nr:hypothetical protein [uncultured Campylobacter sp.]
MTKFGLYRVKFESRRPLASWQKGDKFKKENRRESKFGGDLLNLILRRIGALSKTLSKTRRNLG